MTTSTELHEKTLQSIPSDFPFPLSPDDLSYDLATRAHSGTSFSPELRGRQEQAGYIGDMVGLWENLKEKADTPEKLTTLSTALETYREGYLKKDSAHLQAKSRCLSTMITGPSGFNVRWAEKTNSSEHKRCEEFLDWEKRARGFVLGCLEPPPDTDEVRLEKLILQVARMKELNKDYRKAKGDIDKMTTIDDKMKKTLKDTKENYYIGPQHFVPFEGFSLTSINGKIKRLTAKIASEEVRNGLESKDIIVNDDLTITDNPEANRIQLFFSGKPDADIRQKLKSNGFRWAPSVGAWQAYRTQNTVWKIKHMFGIEINL